MTDYQYHKPFPVKFTQPVEIVHYAPEPMPTYIDEMVQREKDRKLQSCFMEDDMYLDRLRRGQVNMDLIKDDLRLNKLKRTWNRYDFISQKNTKDHVCLERLKKPWLEDTYNPNSTYIEGIENRNRRERYFEDRSYYNSIHDREDHFWDNYPAWKGYPKDRWKAWSQGRDNVWSVGKEKMDQRLDFPVYRDSHWRNYERYRDKKYETTDDFKLARDSGRNWFMRPEKRPGKYIAGDFSELKLGNGEIRYYGSWMNASGKKLGVY